MSTCFSEYYLKHDMIIEEIEQVLLHSSCHCVIGLEGGACRSKWMLLKRVAQNMNKAYIRISKDEKKGYVLREIWNQTANKNGYILHLESIDHRTLHGTYDLIKGLNLTHCRVIQTTNSEERDMKLTIYE